MSLIKLYPNKKTGNFKILNAVNNGPCYRRHAADQPRSNFQSYKDAVIPYQRNHDASHSEIYGGEHSVDISAIFPDFNANPYDPASYDFACTDEMILIALEAGTKTFYRLGQKIEHYIKKYNIYPPADFHKWAVVCEQIIRHYTKGWANGFYHDMPYWEIWNEPDLDLEEDSYRRTWGGTKALFFDFFEIVAKHLKNQFPDLKIGGPALAGRSWWAKEFIEEMHTRNVPLDFFSWHIYCNEPSQMMLDAKLYRDILDKNGYTDTESILNEWNYIDNWSDRFLYSVETIHSIKGAAFVMACMSASSRSSIDMLMYYDARPTIYNGMWDYYTYKELKGYYPFKFYGEFYKLHDIEWECDDDKIYVLAGTDDEGKIKTVVTYYSNNDSLEPKEIVLDFGKESNFKMYLLDKNHDAECVKTGNISPFKMEVNTCVMICEE